MKLWRERTGTIEMEWVTGEMSRAAVKKKGLVEVRVLESRERRAGGSSRTPALSRGFEVAIMLLAGAITWMARHEEQNSAPAGA